MNSLNKCGLFIFVCGLLLLASCVSPSQKCEGLTHDYEVIDSRDAYYPSAAYRMLVEGWVIVELSVSERGEPLNIRVIDNHPSDIFDESALAAASQMKFSPRVIDCEKRRADGAKFRFTYKPPNIYDLELDEDDEQRLLE